MKIANKKVLSLFLSLALVLGILVGTMPQVSFAQSGENQVETLTILHVNDVHGRYLYQDAEQREPSIGHARLKSKVDSLREEGNVLLLDAGDVVHGTVDVTLSEGEAMIKLMNLVGFDALVPGNHDFNYGYERLLELKDMADFPIVAANVVKEADGSSDFKPYMIKEFDGFKVGIFGISTEETKVKSNPKNTEGIEFKDYIETSKEMVKELEEKEVDVVVGLMHIGIDEESDVTTIDIAKNVEGIDVIVDGHSHTKLPKGKLVGDTLIAQSGSNLANIGMIELEIKDGKVENKKAFLFTVKEAADLVPDKDIEAEIEKISGVNEKIKGEFIGKTKVDLVGEREVVRTGESTLGNVVTDAMLRASDADIAFTNGGGIRASITAGDITLGDVMKAFPFTNFLSVIEVTGDEVVDALEHGVESYPGTAGKFPHVAGMKYEFDPSKPAGKRILKVLLGENPIELDKNYKLVTNDFVAVGGDGYSMFEGKKILAEGALLSDVLVEYIKSEVELDPKIEGRIVALELEEQEKEDIKEEVKETIKEEVKEKVKEEIKIYTVVKGDWLSKIAIKFNTTWRKLAEINNIKNPNLIFPGQEILIP